MIIVIAYLMFECVLLLLVLAHPFILTLGKLPLIPEFPYIVVLALGSACAAYGLLRRARWGRTLTIAMLVLVVGILPPILAFPYIVALTLGFACAAYGLLRRACWGRTLAIAVLVAQMVGNAGSVVEVSLDPARAARHRQQTLRDVAAHYHRPLPVTEVSASSLLVNEARDLGYSVVENGLAILYLSSRDEFFVAAP